MPERSTEFLLVLFSSQSRDSRWVRGRGTFSEQSRSASNLSHFLPLEMGLRDELLKSIWHAFTALDLDKSGKVSKSQLKV